MRVADFIGGRGEAIAFMRLARIWRDDADPGGLVTLSLMLTGEGGISGPER